MTILLNEGLEFNLENLALSVENDFSNATDLADYLVGKDIPFRSAYQIVGKIVKYCLERKFYLKTYKLANLRNSILNLKMIFLKALPQQCC